mgnify:CR=1 FL=1|nr:MAG TPA: intron associated endonuclease [Caudoviricetes sp.]
MEIYNDTYCVYIHINKINGKKYVGQTVSGDNPNKRWKNGMGYKTQKLFYRAIQKYGWDGFDHEIVASNLTLEEANHFEEILIDKLDTMNLAHGYNLKSGGENNRLSEETKRKISDAHKGKTFSDEQRKNISEGHKGGTITDEHKKRISEANKGKKLSDETKMKIGQASLGRNVGRKHTEEELEKMRKKKKCKNGRVYHKNTVMQLSEDGDVINVYESMNEAFRKTHINSGHISECCRDIRKMAGGYKWCLINNIE